MFSRRTKPPTEDRTVAAYERALYVQAATYESVIADLREQVRWLRAQTAPTVHPAPFSADAAAERALYYPPRIQESPSEEEEDIQWFLDNADLDPDTARNLLASHGIDLPVEIDPSSFD